MSENDLPEADRVEGAPHPRETTSLIGQGAAEAQFLEAYNTGRLHHAWLLTGPRGIGKATLAWRIARFLLANPDPPGAGLFAPEPARSLDIPDDHPVAIRVRALSDPGLMLCRRVWDEKAKRFKTALTVDEIRQLKSFYGLSAADGGWRIAIVDAADEMNTAAANALLKLLEEPPERALILLVCHRPARLLPTIRSRCRTLKLSTLATDDIRRALQAAGVEAAEVATVGALADGSVGEAVRLLSVDGPKLYGEILSLLEEAPNLSRPALDALAASAAGRDAEARYDALLRLTGVALARLARAGVTGPSADGLGREAQIAGRLAPDHRAAGFWAEALQEIQSRSGHARAVNLDPAQVILDMFLKIEKTAARIALPA